MDRARRYYEATHLLPMNHVLVLRDSLAERYPWLPRNLYDAMCRARASALRRFHFQLEAYVALGAVSEEAVREAEQRMTYGVAANRTVLETAVRYAVEQGLIERSLDLEELVFPTLLSL